MRRTERYQEHVGFVVEVTFTQVSEKYSTLPDNNNVPIISVRSKYGFQIFTCTLKMC